MSEALRIVVAGPSIMSDWRNPAATTNRAVAEALIELGHEVTYLEPRRSEAMVDLLRARGAGPIRDFAEAYPRLAVRTVELPQPFQAASWAGQFLSTASGAIVLDGCPPVVADGFSQFAQADLRVFVEREADDESWLTLESGNSEPIPYRPAVLEQSWSARRTGLLLVVYDDADLGRSVADRVGAADLVVSGRADLPGWEFVPEVRLPERYGRVERVLVVDGASTIDPARVWLARANGATAWGILRGQPDDSMAAVAVGLETLGAIDWGQATPATERYSARLVARAVARGLGA